MKLGTVLHEGQKKPVAVIDETILLDLSVDFPDMGSIVEAGEASLEVIRAKLADPERVLARQHVQMCCPIMPVQYRDCMVHELHLQNCYDQFEKLTGKRNTIPQVWYDQPIYYKGNRMSFIGSGEEIIWPDYSDHLDFELELAIVVGKKGRGISKADALAHIFGYTILNDVSARDAQVKEMAGGLGPAKGKDFDTGNILGPWIVTADEIPHPVALEMTAKVNGEYWGGGSSSSMHHDFADIIAHISASETIYPGEVIGSGTVGTGCGLELGRKLSPDDRIELTIEKIGTLENTIRRI